MFKIEKTAKEEQNFVKGVVYETTLWTEEVTGKLFTKCLKCGQIEYLDDEHYTCSKCGEEFGDYHHDFIRAEQVEELGWSYLMGISKKVEKANDLTKSVMSIVKGESVDLNMVLSDVAEVSKHHLGFSHSEFDSSFGDPVESEIVRKTINFNGVEYPDYTWKVGFKVNDELFEYIKSGEINSFSFGGLGLSEELFETKD